MSPRSTRLWTTLLVVGACGATTALGLAQGAPEPREPARTSARLLEHDAGLVPAGSTIRAEFVVRNDGSRPLRITDSRSSCACVVVAYDREIAPGGTGAVRVEVATRRFDGRFETTALVTTDDPARETIELRVTGEIEPLLVVRPGHARHLFGRRTVAQRLWAADGRPIEILRATTTTRQVVASYRLATREERDPAGPERQWVVETTIAEGAPTGQFAGRLIVETDHPRQPIAEIVVSGVLTRGTSAP